jgi:hypothetical protein
MGYFSNGTEGESFRDGYCYRCVNWRDFDDGRGPGCPIMDVHFAYNGDQFKDEKVREILTMLISREEVLAPDGVSVDYNRCTMFLTADGAS